MTNPGIKESRIVVANFNTPQKWAHKGARVWVISMAGDPENVEIVCKSRGGTRYLKIWTRIKYLSAARVKTIPPNFEYHRPWYHGRTPEFVVEIINSRRAEN